MCVSLSRTAPNKAVLLSEDSTGDSPGRVPDAAVLQPPCVALVGSATGISARFGKCKVRDFSVKCHQ